MKNLILTLALAAASAMTATAQYASTQSAKPASSMADLNAQRVAEAVPSKAQQKQMKAMKKAAIATAKSEAKNMKASGWAPAPSTEDLVTQLTERNLRQKMRKGCAPAYFIATTTARAGSYGMARKQAMARCRTEIAQSLRMEIAGLIETAEQNVELTSGQHETVAKFCDTGMQHYEQNIGRSEAVVEAIREKDGQTEVLISVAIDSSQILNMVFSDLAGVDAEVAQKLKTSFE